jgi:hypothetical protein
MVKQYQSKQFKKRGLKMAEFVSFDPESEVSGSNIQLVIKAHRALGFDIAACLSKHKLNRVQPNDWVNLQTYLDCLKDIQQEFSYYYSFYSLIAIGTKVIDYAMGIPNPHKSDTNFEPLNNFYQLRHRGMDVGEYSQEFLSEKHLRVTARNPYPSDFDYGLVWGMARMRVSNGQVLRVIRAESPSRRKGDASCVYDLIW